MRVRERPRGGAAGPVRRPRPSDARRLPLRPADVVHAGHVAHRAHQRGQVGGVRQLHGVGVPHLPALMRAMRDVAGVYDVSRAQRQAPGV